MADQEVLELSPVGALVGSEAWHVVDQDGNSRHITLSMVTGFGGGAGFDPDIVVRVATQSAGTLATDFEAGDVVDGVTLDIGDDILIKNQIDGSENRIYTVAASGPPTPSTYTDTSAELAGILVLVSEGSNNANTLWRCTNEEPIVIGTDDIVFARVNGIGGFEPGTDLGDIIIDQFGNWLVQFSVLEVNRFKGEAIFRSDEGDMGPGNVNDTSLPTTAATYELVTESIADAIASLGDSLWVGGLDCSTDPDYPEAVAGQVRYASAAGTLGDKPIAFGDIIYSIDDSYGGTYDDVFDQFTVLPRNAWRKGGVLDPDAGFPSALQGQIFEIIDDGTLEGVEVVTGNMVVALDDVGAGGTWSSWFLLGSGSGSSTFLGLSDVDTTGLADGDVWAYDASAGMLVPVPLSGGAAALNDLTDVNVVSPTNKSIIWYNSSSGLFEKATIGDLLDIYSTTQGSMLFRSSPGWGVLAFGTAGYALKTNGSGNDPSWGPVAVKSQTEECIAGFIASPSDKTYKLVVKMPHGGTITETTTICASGTCTATFKINTTALGGTANSVSSGEQSQSHSSSNVFSAGDDIQLTISSNSTCVDMSWSIKYTRTLE